MTVLILNLCFSLHRLAFKKSCSAPAELLLNQAGCEKVHTSAFQAKKMLCHFKVVASVLPRQLVPSNDVLLPI